MNQKIIDCLLSGVNSNKSYRITGYPTIGKTTLALQLLLIRLMSCSKENNVAYFKNFRLAQFALKYFCRLAPFGVNFNVSKIYNTVYFNNSSLRFEKYPRFKELVFRCNISYLDDYDDFHIDDKVLETLFNRTIGSVLLTTENGSNLSLEEIQLKTLFKKWNT